MLFDIVKLFELDIAAKIEAVKASFELPVEQATDHVKQVSQQARSSGFCLRSPRSGDDGRWHWFYRTLSLDGKNRHATAATGHSRPTRCAAATAGPDQEGDGRARSIRHSSSGTKLPQ
jgi:hypothetical protein